MGNDLLKYTKRKRTKLLKKAQSTKKALKFFLVIIVAVFLTIGIMDLNGFSHLRYPVEQSVLFLMDMCIVMWAIATFGVILALEKSKYERSRQDIINKEIDLRLKSLSSRIDIHEDDYTELRDAINNHARILGNHTGKIGKIEDYLSDDDDFPNEAKEYISGDPRAEKKEIS